MKSWLSLARPLGFAAAAAIAFGACDEQLNGGGACPALCPGQQTQLRDTTFFAVDLDTAIAGYPSLGAELRLFLASFADTLESAAVVRFDSLPSVFRRPNSPEDSAIVAIDSAYLRLTVVTGDTLGQPTTVDVYDVDMDGAEDADPTVVRTVFTPDRLVGTRTIPADSLRDSVTVPLDLAFLLGRIQDSTKRRARLGIRVRDGSQTRKLTLVPQNGGGSSVIVFRPSPDTAVAKLAVAPRSTTPTDESILANDYADYQVILRSTPDAPAGTFRIGGLPSRRAYLRFDIPASILDSQNVVRATLQLTQRPARFSPEATDTVGIGHFGVVASPAVTDLSRVLTFIDRLPSQTDTMVVTPADSGRRDFEIIGWVRVWRGTKTTKTQRALALAMPSEGSRGSVVDFFSLEAAAALRPRLRITYMPRNEGFIR